MLDLTLVEKYELICKLDSTFAIVLDNILSDGKLQFRIRKSDIGIFKNKKFNYCTTRRSSVESMIDWFWDKLLDSDYVYVSYELGTGTIVERKYMFNNIDNSWTALT